MRYAKSIVGGLAAIALISGSSIAQARSLTLTSGFPPGSIPPVAHQALADWLAENSDLEVQVFSMTLLSLPETSSGLRDGVADMGYLLTQYYPAEYAHSNLAADMTMLSTIGTPTEAPGIVMSAAFAEYVLFNCPECVEEFANQNQLYLGSGASSAYALMCTSPIETAEDLRGKSLRVGGGNFGRWAEHFGATRVTMPGAEMYEALSQGVVDCSTLSTPELINWQLFDVVKHVITGVPGGVYGGVASNNINLDTWRSLTDEQRAVLMQGAARVTAGVAVGYQVEAQKAEEETRSRGIPIGPAPEELQSASDAFIEADMASIAEEFRTTYGIDDVDAKMTTVRELVDKWKGLLADVDETDMEAVSTVLWDELYSKVDLASYGQE
jgi:TRAP-type transport system periplasmic protein